MHTFNTVEEMRHRGGGGRFGGLGREWPEMLREVLTRLNQKLLLLGEWYNLKGQCLSRVI